MTRGFSHYESCPRCVSNGRDTRGDNLGIYRDGSAHCFSCGYHKHARFTFPVEKDDHDVKTKGIPSDFTREVPSVAWKWLLQYGLGYKYWREFVGWSESNSRLIFTIEDDFAIGRYIQTDSSGSEGTQALSDRNPNHRTPSKWYSYGDCHRKPHIFAPKGDFQTPDISGTFRESNQVVLVEDLISAHKVGKLQTCIPLFGTQIFDACIPVLRHLHLPITLWLDQDQQGNIVKKASNLSVLTGLPVSYLFTNQDPKELSLGRIERELQN